MVEDPVAISFDARGRMWVVEMRGYMHDMGGTGEDQPTGRIKILESSKGDGKYDKATIFLDGLVMPRAVLPVRGGALIGEPPNLWFCKEIDGRAGAKIAIASDFGARGGQPEYMANGLTPDIDNWIYAANYSKRLRFQGGKWAADATEPHGQWGLTQDDFGRLYFDYNEDLLRANLLPAPYFLRNPNWPGGSATNVKVMLDQTVWPSHPTPGVNRGYEEGILRDDGTLRACTANCGVCVYRGNLFAPSAQGNVFICEPAGNLVKRVMLGESRGLVSADNVYYGAEFLTSTDERFRPVNLTVGPDGALYLVDFHRGVLEHERFITNYLAKNIQQRKLKSPVHLGRIFRIIPEGAPEPTPFHMPIGDETKLVECLAHANGWVRDMAQRLLVDKHDPNVATSLQQMAASHPNPIARLHALWTIEGMNLMEIPIALAALHDKDEHIRAAAIRLCEPFLIPATQPEVLPALLELTRDPRANVRLQLLLTLSNVADERAEDAVALMLESYDGIDPMLARDSALSGLWGRELEFLQRLLARRAWEEESPDRAEALSALARCVLAERRPEAVKQLLQLAAEQNGSAAWRRAALLRAVEVHPVAPARRLPKLIYLDAEPPSLAPLLDSDGDATRKLATVLAKRLAWPGKPGVPPPPKVTPLTPSQQALFERGRQIFTNVCAACHQLSGLGQQGLAPPLVDSEWLLGPEQRTIRIVLNGLSGPVKVEGMEYHLEMPAIGALQDEDIAAVLTYARRSWDHTAGPVDPNTVARIREQTKARAASWTAEELMKIDK